MKKLLMLSFIAILVLTGCDASVMDTMSCSLENTTGNLTTRTNYNIDYQGNEVKKVRITYDYNQNEMNNNGNTNGNTETRNATGSQSDTEDNDMNNNGTNNGTSTQNNTDGVGTGTDGTTNDNGNTGAQNGTGNNAMTNNNDNNTSNRTNTQKNTDGVGTGTDGTTNDTQIDNDGIVDGIVGSAIDGIVGGVTDVILDVAGLRDRHATVQNTYGNIQGFSVQNTTDTNNNYKVTYVIDYDTISDNDLRTLNLSRDLDTLRSSYISQGFTCK